MNRQKKRATEVTASIAQGGHVNFTKFSVHLHFNRTKVICKCVKDLGISQLLLII